MLQRTHSAPSTVPSASGSRWSATATDAAYTIAFDCLHRQLVRLLICSGSDINTATTTFSVGLHAKMRAKKDVDVTERSFHIVIRSFHVAIRRFHVDGQASKVRTWSHVATQLRVRELTLTCEMMMAMLVDCVVLRAVQRREWMRQVSRSSSSVTNAGCYCL